MKRSIKYLCLFAVLSSALVAIAADPADAGERDRQPSESAQAKAKLAEIRGRIAALTNRLHDELKERDARSTRLREAESASPPRAVGWRICAALSSRPNGVAGVACRGDQAQAVLDTERAALQRRCGQPT